MFIQGWAEDILTQNKTTQLKMPAATCVNSTGHFQRCVDKKDPRAAQHSVASILLPEQKKVFLGAVHSEGVDT